MGFKQNKRIGKAMEAKVFERLLKMMKKYWVGYSFDGIDNLNELEDVLEDLIDTDRRSLRLLRRVNRAYGIKYDILAIGDVEEILKEEEE